MSTHCLALCPILRQAPASPELAKWTKLGPLLDRLLLGRAIHSAYGAAFSAAFSATSRAAPLPAQVADADHAYLNEQCWSQVAGKRAKTTLKFLTDQEATLRMCILSLIYEPARVLVRIFFAWSSEYALRGSWHFPGICSMTTARYSPLVSMLQYISTMSSELYGGRVQMILHMVGEGTVRGFWQRHRSLALLLAESWLTMSSWLWVRLQDIGTCNGVLGVWRGGWRRRNTTALKHEYFVLCYFVSVVLLFRLLVRTDSTTGHGGLRG